MLKHGGFWNKFSLKFFVFSPEARFWSLEFNSTRFERLIFGSFQLSRLIVDTYTSLNQDRFKTGKQDQKNQPARAAVNFTNILQAAFAKKLHSQAVRREKLWKNTFV